MSDETNCKKCKGSGQLRKGEPCRTCKGSGKVTVTIKDGRAVVTPAVQS